MPRIRFFLPLLLPGLAACSGGDVRDTLGLSRRAPDEFVVYSRPPLSVPPEFDLRPPRPGAENPNHVSSEETARETLLGTKTPLSSLEDLEDAPASDTAVVPVIESEAPSNAQAKFLGKLGVDDADPEIRKQLSQDVQAAPKKKKKAQSLYEKIVGDAQDEPVVDATKEAERIRANKDAGKPVNEGETPVLDKKNQSVIDRIL